MTIEPMTMDAQTLHSISTNIVHYAGTPQDDRGMIVFVVIMISIAAYVMTRLGALKIWKD